MENTILKEFQLGAKENPETKSIDFKLYSKNATKVLLCIFDTPQGADPVMTLTMSLSINGRIFFRYSSLKIMLSQPHKIHF